MDSIFSNIKRITLAVMLLLCTAQVFAHEPSEIDVDYNAITGHLDITIHHKVNSTSVHYIKTVNVYLNRQGLQLEDDLIINQKLWGQKIRNEQKLSYIVNDLQPGDKLRITADCSLFGMHETTYKVKESDWRKLSGDQ